MQSNHSFVLGFHVLSDCSRHRFIHVTTCISCQDTHITGLPTVHSAALPRLHGGDPKTSLSMLQTVWKLSLELLELTVSAPVIWFLCEKALLPSLSQQNSFHTAPAKVRVAGYSRDLAVTGFTLQKAVAARQRLHQIKIPTTFHSLHLAIETPRETLGIFVGTWVCLYHLVRILGVPKFPPPLVTTCISIIANIVSRTLWSLSNTSSTYPLERFFGTSTLAGPGLSVDFGQDNGRQRTCPGEAMKLFTKSYEQKWQAAGEFGIVSGRFNAIPHFKCLTLAFNGPFNLASVSRSKTPQLACKNRVCREARPHFPPHSQVLSIP